jgi:hypothetical protein
MPNISRKDFIRYSLSTMAVAGLSKSGVGAVAAGPSLNQQGSVTVSELNPVIRVYPAGAKAQSGDVRFGTAELGSMLPFFGTGEVIWTVSVAEAGRYDLALCCSTTKAGTPINIKAGKTSVDYAVPVTEGFFYPHPEGPVDDPGDPSGESFFRMREFYLFDRVAVPGEFHLSRGVNVVRLRVSGDRGKEILRLRSLELTPATHRAAIEADKKRARARRANTDWFANAGYGIWFHFLDITTPPHGPRKPYEQAVNELDVDKLVETVASTGAKYLIFSVNHGNPTCPAPIRSWERLHPGWTTKRDLISELADALSRRGMRLMLYMNPPGLGGMALKPGTVLGVPAYNEDEYARQLIEVFREFGERYGSRVEGYWFDSTFEATECFPNLPFDAFDEAIKTGHPDRLVAWNNWVFPTETEWQDYWAGELTDLPVKLFAGRYIRHSVAPGVQAHVALRFDANWLHITEDEPMPPPRFTARELADYIRSCQADKVPVTLGLGIFQDGTLGPQSISVLKEVRRLVRGDNAPA